MEVAAVCLVLFLWRVNEPEQGLLGFVPMQYYHTTP